MLKMDCEKIIEIYNQSCNQHYSVTGIYVSSKVKIGVQDLILKADNNCLRSIELLEKYCKSESKNT